MKSYTIQVVVGNVYEVKVKETTLERARATALELATEGELIEGGRAILHAEEIPTDGAIREWARYIVTDWHDEKPNKKMYVYTNEVDAEKVTGQVTTDDYRFPSSSLWSRTMADKWTWTEATTSQEATR